MVQGDDRYVSDGDDDYAEGTTPLPELDAAGKTQELLEVTGKSRDRLDVFQGLAQGIPKTELDEHYDPSYSTVNNYVRDWKDAGLVEGGDGDYELTEYGVAFYELLLDYQDMARDLQRRDVQAQVEDSTLSLDEYQEVLDDLQED